VRVWRRTLEAGWAKSFPYGLRGGFGVSWKYEADGAARCSCVRESANTWTDGMAASNAAQTVRTTAALVITCSRAEVTTIGDTHRASW
jgi:hypothetical protein